MTTPAFYTDRLTALETLKTELEGAIRTISLGGTTVTIEGRTLVRPRIQDVQAELNRTVAEINRLKRRIVGESTAMPTIRLTRDET